MRGRRKEIQGVHGRNKKGGQRGLTRGGNVGTVTTEGKRDKAKK